MVILFYYPPYNRLLINKDRSMNKVRFYILQVYGVPLPNRLMISLKSFRLPGQSSVLIVSIPEEIIHSD